MRGPIARVNCAVYPSRSRGVVLVVFPISIATVYNVKREQIIQASREET